MINRETRLPYATFDHFDTRVRQARYRHQPDWKDDYLAAIKRGDYDAAHVIRLRNDERYVERCEREAREVFPVEGAQLQSLDGGGREGECK